MLTLILGIVAIVVFYLYLNEKRNYWKKRNVPHRQTKIFFGDFLDFFLKPEFPAEYFKKIYNEFRGPYVGFLAFTKPVLIIKDLDIIKSILIKDFNTFRDRFSFANENNDKFFGKSLLGMKGNKWRIVRSKLSPVFTSGKLKLMQPLINECGENMVEYMRKNVEESSDVKSIAIRYTTDLISSCVFGIDANSFERKDSEFFIDVVPKLFPPTFLQYLKILTYFMVPASVKLFKYTFIDESVGKILLDLINETIRQREDSKFVRNDLIDVIINLKKQDGDNEYSDGLTVNALEFFSAGQESTSQLISFTIHELCINPDIQDRLRNEIEDCIAKHGGLTYEAIQDMEYLNMVVSESLRKYTAFPFLQRICNDNYTIRETGLEIEKDTIVIILPLALHWDPQYFPNPEIFDPERFSENKKNIVPYSYLPFGEGPRNCIGERLGVLGAKLGIIHLVRNFQINRNSLTTEKLTYTSSALLASAEGGIQVTFSKL